VVWNSEAMHGERGKLISALLPIMATITTEPTSLHTHISTFTSLHNRLQHLRTIPLAILRAPDVSLLPTSTISVPLQDLKEVTAVVQSEEVQGALKVARDSGKDLRGVRGGLRRELRKRRSVCFLFFIFDY